MNLVDSVKQHPYKAILGSATSVIAIVTALFALDARYAHAADVEKKNIETKLVIQETATTLRKQMLEDKLFELDVKKAQSPNQRLTPVEQAMQERYRRQLDELKVSKERPR
jgi:hypothetical protein